MGGSEGSPNGKATPRSSQDEEFTDARAQESAPALPTTNQTNLTSAQSSQKPPLPPWVYVSAWITLSSTVILFNKYILSGRGDTKGFPFPVFLTTWHLIYASIATQILARTTHLLDGLKNVRMTGRVYMRAIVPIGALFSLSLICGNKAYLYLNVSFIQMLKATMPVAVLIVGFGFGVEKPNLRTFANVSGIVIGVMLASYGELAFDIRGFSFQMGGVVFESMRLVMIQQLLSGDKYKMDPLVSLYFFAPVCAAMNIIATLFLEWSDLSLSAIMDVGLFTLFINASVAFLLNISVVFLIGKTSSLVMTLCGVLKDILLVAASLLIWHNVLSFTQVVGYSLAIAGLLYYKLGGDKFKDSYHRLKLEGSQMWQDYGERHPGRRRAAVGATTVLVFIIVFASLYPSTILDTSSGSSRDMSPPAFGDTYVAARKLDIVISAFDEQLDDIAKGIQKLKECSALKERNGHFIIYSKKSSQSTTSIKSATKADDVRTIANKGLEGDTYLHHITREWNSLATHTLFLKADLHLIDQMTKRLTDFFIDKSGFLPLASTLSTCTSSSSCSDSGTTWPRVPQIYAMANENLPPADLLLTEDSAFLVSAKRVHATPKNVYLALLDILDSDEKHFIHSDKHDDKTSDSATNPFFAKSLQRAWPLVFRCNEKTIAKECRELKTVRSADALDDQCQCLD